jgi:hypothetical protein
MGGEQIAHVVMDAVGNEDTWFGHGYFNILRRRAPKPSTTITHNRMVSRMAET